jgi:hypothetical protein
MKETLIFLFGQVEFFCLPSFPPIIFHFRLIYRADMRKSENIFHKLSNCILTHYSYLKKRLNIFKSKSYMNTCNDKWTNNQKFFLFINII